GLVAVALAHNSVEVWDWAGQAHPLRIHRAQGGDPCLLYHARLWGRALGELRVAAGTAFNQVLVWSPGGGVDVLRLKGHWGVIFRVAWREDGMRLASASDDRTVRVWDEEDRAAAGEEEGRDGGGRLVWTGWGHASRVWDVGFADLGVVSCGE
ncbi:unnamed protein product, partial [Ectocarpus sp. 13 AM-2016]